MIKTALISSLEKCFLDQQVEDFIPLFADRIVHVHVKDYQVTPGNSREKLPEEYTSRGGNLLLDRLVGQGSVRVQAAFEALKAIGYHGAVALETGPMGSDEEQSFRYNLEVVNRYIAAYL